MFVLLPAISLEVDQFKNSCILKLSQLYRHRKKKKERKKKNGMKEWSVLIGRESNL